MRRLCNNRVTLVCTKTGGHALHLARLAADGAGVQLQLTKRRMRMFITMPKARKVNMMEEPP